MIQNTSVVRPMLLYITSKAVIPAKAGIPARNTGFRVKPGMTNELKGVLTRYAKVPAPIFRIPLSEGQSPVLGDSFESCVLPLPQHERVHQGPSSRHSHLYQRSLS